MSNCALCRFLRILLLGAAGALGGSWLALQMGVARDQLIMPATLGVLVALGLGVIVWGRRR